MLPAVAKEEEERSAWLVLARGPLVRAMAERKPLMLLLLLLLAVPPAPSPLLLTLPASWQPLTRRRPW